MAAATISGGDIQIKGLKVGSAKLTIADGSRTAVVTVTVAATGATGISPPLAAALSIGSLQVLAANDLGMHCADQDYQIFSILPPFNVVHAQVVQKGTSGSKPRILSGADVDVVYSAASSTRDPAGAGSINTTSQNKSGVFKSNFWQRATLPNGKPGTLGALAYRRLYPGTDKLGQCDPAIGPCPSVLDLFSPIPGDLGIPVPDPAKLPALAAAQQAMPSSVSLTPYVSHPYGANQPQRFDRFDTDLPFFAKFPFGTTLKGINWFAADGIPILPIDDAGRRNAYPMMRVAAVTKGASTSTLLASTDIVLPVASEADCQGCHVDPDDFAGIHSGRAATFAFVTNYTDGKPWKVIRAAEAPGPEKLLNAAKINILRLHDAKHGSRYTSSANGRSTPCLHGTEASCLDSRRAIQCAQCHYSPALDLAQVGPIDETSQGVNGRQQTRHISMSRAMHGITVNSATCSPPCRRPIARREP